jgi:hypothetical protein
MRINQALRDVKLVPKMTLMLSIVLFSTTFLLITWLSHLDGLSGYSFDLGTMVISGELHQALAHSEFWQQALTNSAKVKNLNYLVQWPALLWAIFCVVLLVFFSKITWISPSSLTGLCAGLVFTPYLLGTIYLQHNQLSINQSGPIVALMVFSIMYLVLPATFISLHNKNTNRNTK